MPAVEPSKGPADAMRRLRRLVERLRAAPDTKPDPTQDASPERPLDFESVMGQVRAKVYARRAGVPESDEPVVEIPAFPALEARLPRFSRPASRVDVRARYTLTELMSCSDADFVHNVYRAQLQRDADSEGYRRHYTLLARGEISRLEMLWQFGQSEEGRRHQVVIDGLRRALLLQRMSRWPVVGALISLAWQIRNLPITAARLEAQERRIFAAEQDLRAALDALSQATESHLNDLSERSAAAIRTVSGSLRRLDREKASRAQAIALMRRLADVRKGISRLEDGARGAATRDDLLEIAEAFIPVLTQPDGRGAAVDVPDTRFEEFYLAFENTFRGTREDIKRRMEVYLPIVGAVERAPVIDVGCGRGEWLELLKESRIEARGVDMNSAMVRECRDRGLDVVEGDAIEHMSRLPASSIGAVTGMQIVEHLPYLRLLALLDEACRVLRPGGVAIFETPNPENVIVGSCNFWNDPTHVRPLPPESFKHAAELHGFSRVEILRLHPFPPEAHFEPGDGMRDQLNHLFYGPQDYAILAYKPAAERDR